MPYLGSPPSSAGLCRDDDDNASHTKVQREWQVFIRQSKLKKNNKNKKVCADKKDKVSMRQLNTKKRKTRNSVGHADCQSLCLSTFLYENSCGRVPQFRNTKCSRPQLRWGLIEECVCSCHGATMSTWGRSSGYWKLLYVTKSRWWTAPHVHVCVKNSGRHQELLTKSRNGGNTGVVLA